MLGYEVLKKLADGAAAEAFLAREEGSQDRVILEIVRPELAEDPELIERFLDEAQIRQNLNHPNVTRRVSTGRTPDGRLFVVTAPVDGESLTATLWSQGSLHVQDVIRLALPLCDALDYLHRAGVIHGNVKPDNVYLSGGLKAFNPKLLDFGLALFRGVHGMLGVKAQPSAQEYQAPECIRGQPADPRSDVYALGLLMYEAVTGFPPFASASTSAMERSRRHLTPPALPASCSALGPIIDRCLKKNPSDRYPSAQGLREALAGELEGHTSHPPALVPHEEIATEREGDLIGSFELTHVVGEGSMGRVFAARHARLGRKVALKLLRPGAASDHLLVERFFREARAANQINHPHIIEIFDFVEERRGESGRRVYLVMELLSGVSLGSLLRAGPLSIQRTIKIVRQVCAALEAAHRVGIIHRDVKPDNIFLISRGEQHDYVKVLDFGVAKLAASPGELPVVKTLAGAVVGTPAYMSPEQAAALETDHRTDIYAVGNILYRALQGHLPFEAQSYGQLLVKIVSEAPPPLTETTAAGEALPPELARIILCCLDKDVEKRPASMVALQDLLEPFACHPSSVAFPMQPMLHRKRSWGLRSWVERHWLALAGTLAIGGLAAITFF